MTLVWSIAIGAIVGWIANRILRNTRKENIRVDTFVGVIGALLGFWIFGILLGLGSLDGALTLWGAFWAIMGAIFLVAVIRAAKPL